MLVKIGDFGTSNFALNVKKYGMSANPTWISPEREKYLGGVKDPGLSSEVFSLSALTYNILTCGDMPYIKHTLPSKRSTFKDKSKKIDTGFYPESRGDLKRYCNDLFNKEQLDHLADVFEKGLAIKPSERYQSGKELFQAINNALYPKNKIISFVR